MDLIKHEDKQYLVSNEKPKTGDLVITEKYGIWLFHEGTAPIPYWCNPNTCKKLIEFNPK
jgi:hypothetical protein